MLEIALSAGLLFIFGGLFCLYVSNVAGWGFGRLNLYWPLYWLLVGACVGAGMNALFLIVRRLYGYQCG